MGERRNAAEYVAAGGALLGASAAADGLVAYDRKRRNMDGPVRAAVKRKFTRRHAGQLGVKLAGRAAFAAGAPLAAYGGYKLVKPDGNTPKINAKRDVAKPLAQGIALKDLKQTQEQRLAKADLSAKENRRIYRHKKAGEALSLVGAGIGTAALALRAPEAARAAMKLKRVGSLKPVQRLAAKEGGSTKVSNTLLAVGAGAGSAGGFNYAAQQRAEAKQFKKSLYDGVVRGLGRVRVVERTKPGFVTVYDSKDVKRFMPESRVTPVPKPKAKKSKLTPVVKPGPQQLELDFGKALSPEKKAEAKARAKRNGRRYPNAYDNMISGGATFGKSEETEYREYKEYKAYKDWQQARDAKTRAPLRKRSLEATAQSKYVRKPSLREIYQAGKIVKADDRFLRQYRDRISPSAEEGYKYLKRGRNSRIADAGVSAGFAGLSGGLGVHALRRGSKGWAAVGGAGAALSGISAARSANDAARWNSKMGRIKAKAKEREAAGQYGRPVVKSLTREQKQGVAMAGGGLAALTAGLSTPRAVSAYEDLRTRQYTRERDAAQNAKRPDGRPDTKRAGEASRVYGEKMKRLKRQTGFKTRAGLLSAGFLTAAPLTWAGTRRAVEKADKHDVDAFMGGALATAGAYQGLGYATHPWQYRQEKAFPAAAKERINQHKAEMFGTDRRGRPEVPPKGDPRWKRFGRTYPVTEAKFKAGPVSIPAHKYKRAMSRLQAGKTQIAITGALATAGGLGAAKLNRKVHPVDERRVKKAFALPKGRLVPKSPLLRKPAVRGSYIGTSMSGKKFTVRGSVR